MKSIRYNVQQMDIGDGMKALVSIPSNFRESNIFSQEPDKKKLANLYRRSAFAKRCISIRANTLSSIQWDIMRPSGEPVDDNNEVWRLLTEFNPEANWIDAIRATESDLEIFGEAFWLKLPADSDRPPVALQRLNPIGIEVEKDSSGIQGFTQKLERGNRTFPRERMVYFRDYNPVDDLGGLSDTHVVQAHIEADVNAEQYVSSFFENYALPAVVFEAGDATPEDAASFLEDFRRRFAGVKKQHKAGVVPGKPHILTPDLEKLALERVRKEAQRAICAGYGIPPVMVGVEESANWKIDELRQSLYMETIMPRADYIAGVLNAELIGMFNGNLKFVWNTDDIQALQEDRNAKSVRVVNEFANGIVAKDAAAQELGWDEDQIAQGAPPQPQSNFGRHLARWQQKATRLLNDTGSAACEYETQAIGESLKGAIEGQLGLAKSDGDIRRVFERASMWAAYG